MQEHFNFIELMYNFSAVTLHKAYSTVLNAGFSVPYRSYNNLQMFFSTNQVRSRFEMMDNFRILDQSQVPSTCPCQLPS